VPRGASRRRKVGGGKKRGRSGVRRGISPIFNITCTLGQGQGRGGEKERRKREGGEEQTRSVLYPV
jgi:hypothetical protein